MAGKQKYSGPPIPVLVVGFMILASVLRDAFFGEAFDGDWPIFVGVTLFILFRVMMDSRKSRRPKPAPVPKAPPADGAPGKLPFELPKLKGAPKTERQDAGQQAVPKVVSVSEEERRRIVPSAYRDEDDMERHIEAIERDIRKRKQEKEEPKRELQAPKTEARTAVFSPEALRNAFIYAEIFAPPKALRRRP